MMTSFFIKVDDSGDAAILVQREAPEAAWIWHDVSRDGKIAFFAHEGSGYFATGQEWSPCSAEDVAAILNNQE